MLLSFRDHIFHEPNRALILVIIITSIPLLILPLVQIYDSRFFKISIYPRKKIMIINNSKLKQKEINFNEIKKIDFKGIISKGSQSGTSYYGEIYLRDKNDTNYYLLELRQNRFTFNSDLIQHYIYIEGIQVAQIIVHASQSKVQWFEFSEKN